MKLHVLSDQQTDKLKDIKFTVTSDKLKQHLLNSLEDQLIADLKIFICYP